MQNNRKTGFRFSLPPRARKPCAAPLPLSFSAHHLRSARSVVLGFVMYGAFCECNQCIMPLFGIFSATPHCASHVPKPIAISRQRRHFIHARLTPSRRRRHTCFAYVSIPLLNTFCRLAATGANTLPRPSRYSITTATGSKRSSADSDLLLCHVRLWRTSRLRFWCVSGCEHGKIGFILIVPSARILESRPPTHYSGRAGNACTNLLGFFVRYVRTRGSMKLRGAVKLPILPLPLCRTHSPRTARATNSCTREEISKRGERSL